MASLQFIVDLPWFTMIYLSRIMVSIANRDRSVNHFHPRGAEAPLCQPSLDRLGWSGSSGWACFDEPALGPKKLPPAPTLAASMWERGWINDGFSIGKGVQLVQLGVCQKNTSIFQFDFGFTWIIVDECRWCPGWPFGTAGCFLGTRGLPAPCGVVWGCAGGEDSGNTRVRSGEARKMTQEPKNYPLVI